MGNLDNNYHHIKHYKEQSKTKKTVYFSLIITLLFAFAELVGGIVSGSLALVGDSFHMFSDVLALGGSSLAIYFSSKKPTSNFTFGYLRLEVIVAFVNGLMLLLISIYIVIEGISRFFNPREIDLKTMFIIAMIGLIFNIVITVFLSHSLKHEHNLNVQSAIWHFIGDLINSVGVIISSVIIYFTGYKVVDIIMSIFISIVLFKGGYKITKVAFLILMEHSTINVEKVRADILELEQVENVHELHIWNTNDEEKNAAMHLLLKDYEGDISYNVINEVNSILKDKYGIEHTFVEIENIKYNEHKE